MSEANGFVTAAYLQAQDEANYQRLKQIEKADCAKAGIEKRAALNQFTVPR